MTEIEEQELREMGAEIAAATQSPWEPRTIAQAWTPPRRGALHLTMQGWIELDALRSPLLVGELPGVEDLLRTGEVFGVEIGALSAEEAVLCAVAMRDAVSDAFAAALKMRPPGDAEQSAEQSLEDGFGSWMPLLACLVKQCGLRIEESLSLRVERAFTLIAAIRRNEGWRPAGISYALRDIQGDGRDGIDGGSQNSCR